MQADLPLSVSGINQPSDYYNLGTHHRSVTTTSPDAQLWFDRGLQWCDGFNHEEAVRCFARATEYDPNCAMAFWGIAYGIGPNYNKAWTFFDREGLQSSVREATDVLARGAALSEQGQVTPVEKALITALTARFPPVDKIPEDLRPLNHAYADAMRVVYEKHTDDIDVAAFFVEALMCISPRGLWDLDTGKPSGEHTVEARRVNETALAQPDGYYHPVLCHLYIHLMEMSPYPEKALPAADRLRHLVPDASHLLHMPTHIDMAVGDYRRSVDSNQEAIAADDKYFAKGNHASGIYIAYRMHNVCAKMYSALISGRSYDAISAAVRLEKLVDDDVLSTTSPPIADWTEGFLGSLAHIYVRFGRWHDILRLELPTNRTLYCSKTATILYARGVAYSALGRIAEAEAAQRDFDIARALVPASRLNSIPSKQVDVLAVGAAMLTGELEYRRGNYDAAFASLRHAVELEDALPYADPPPWMQPVRHALGGLLLEQDRLEEAEVVFREDLGMAEGFPRRKARLNNVWGLHGLHECLLRLGKTDQARCIEASRDVALGSADVDITTSCYCRLSAVRNGCCH